MFSPALLGSSLSPGWLCLTFDDGPGATVGPGRGPRTLSLAEYLAGEGVPATFFMTGRHVTQHPDAPDRVAALGHLVANHTHTHSHLPELLARGGDVTAEVTRTDDLLGTAVTGPVYVRPPYGDWSAAVADRLNAVPGMSAGHIGPVGWEIDAQDWRMWADRVEPAVAAATYVARVEADGAGIVLMHDSTADSEQIKHGNATAAMVRLLVPLLRSRGYGFLRLDEVPLS